MCSFGAFRALAPFFALMMLASLRLYALETDPASEYTGGETTVFATGRNAFSFPFANLDNEGRRRFAIGNSFFKRNWVQAPASTTARDGLGPHFIARSCGGCHALDGRGAPPAVDPQSGESEPAVALLFRLSIPSKNPRQGVVPEPVYGGQFNNAAIQGVKPEGRMRITYSEIRRRFTDGAPYVLQQPHYTPVDLAYGPMHEEAMLGPRIAPQLVGIGLIEAITDIQIELNAARQAEAGGQVSGRVNRVYDVYSAAMRIGRFGWKANVATLAHQTAGAFNGDIGITTALFPEEPCTQAQLDCLKAVAAQARIAEKTGETGPELDQRTLREVVFYQATLAPAARRGIDDPMVQQGETLFHLAGCAQCHRPSYITGEPPFSELSSGQAVGQKIWPYTDLLLHDMGPELADGRPDFEASGSEWKTPPLWGIGLIKDVNGHTRLLHDGRANGVLEAILWHGGEAGEARKHVLEMRKSERNALVRFVESL